MLKFFGVLAFTCMFMAFQNCSKVDFGDVSPLQNLKSSGNGENYDGKIYVHTDTKNPCANQSINRTVITWNNSRYQLVKKDCAPVVPAQDLADGDVKVDPTLPARITYLDQNFVFDSTQLTQAPDFNCLKKNFGPVDSVKIFSVMGPAGNMLVGQVEAYGSVISMAFRSSLDTSPTNVISGTNQDDAAYIELSKFDSTNSGPDGTNTAYQIGRNDIGAEGYLFCAKPDGRL